MGFDERVLVARLLGHSVLMDNCHIVKDIDLEIFSGETTVIMGPNGSGKSTLLNSMVGTEASNLRSSNETYLIHERNFKTLSLLERSRLFSIVPQFPEWQIGLTVENYFYFSRYNHLISEGGEDLELLNEIVKELSLEPLMKKNMEQLSGGELKRVSVAAALYQNTPIVFLDEPFQALDPQVKNALANFLVSWQKRKGTSFIIASHDFYWSYKISHKAIFLKRGEVLESGETQKVFNAETLKKLYDIPFEWVMSDHKIGFFHPVGSL